MLTSRQIRHCRDPGRGQATDFPGYGEWYDCQHASPHDAVSPRPRLCPPPSHREVDAQSIQGARPSNGLDWHGRLWVWHRTLFRSFSRLALTTCRKSKLAIEFAHKIHTDKPDTSVFWVRGNSRATFEESYRALADALALPRRYEKDTDILALVRDHLQRDDVRPWLMVVDNADDAGVFFINNGNDNISKHPLASYLPKSIKGKILVTSRSLDAAERLVGHSRAIMRLSVMEEVQALELLTTRLEGETDEAAAIELVRALGCIPLAVNQAAAYINRRSPRLSVKSYLEKFRKNEKQKDSLLRSDKGDLGRHEGVSNSVVVTWQVTFEQIKRERRSATNLLSLMSQFQAQNIPESMLHGYDDDVIATSAKIANADAKTESDKESHSDDFEYDMDTLRGYSLVTLPSAGFCEMHPLVQFCTRSWISEFGDPGRWNRLFVNLAATHFPAGKYETWGTSQNLLPHVEALLRSEAKDQGDILDWAELLTNASCYMFEMGKLFRAEMLAEQGAEVRKTALGPDHIDTLRSLSILACTYSELGRPKEAEKLAVEVLETRKAMLGADHPDTLGSMNNLASTLQQQGRWEEAETLGVEVLEACKARLGADHIDTLRSMRNLALTFWNLGRHDEAEKLEVEVLETYKVKLGENHPETLLSMNNLASTLWKRGRREEAEKLGVQVLTTCKAKLGPDNPLTLTSMSNLAITWHSRGRPNDAIVLLRDCVHLQRQNFGHTHPDTQRQVKMLERWQSLHAAAGDISSG
jgi:tetratricopeptide (TPR) repeat protein